MYSDLEKRKDVWPGRSAIFYGKFILWPFNVIVGAVVLYLVANNWIAPQIGYTMPTPDQFMLTRTIPVAVLVGVILYFVDYRKKVPVVKAFTLAMDHYQQGINSLPDEPFKGVFQVVLNHIAIDRLKADRSYQFRPLNDKELVLYPIKPSIKDGNTYQHFLHPYEPVILSLDEFNLRQPHPQGIRFGSTSEPSKYLVLRGDVFKKFQFLMTTTALTSTPTDERLASHVGEPSVPSSDPTQEIVKWKKLLDDGIITTDEFAQKKKDILKL